MTTIRHMGIPVPNMNEAILFWKGEMGLKIVSIGNEEWNGRYFKIAKLEDVEGHQIELVEGPWPAHISLTVDEFPQGMDMTAYKDQGYLEVAFYDVPAVGTVEMVRHK